MDITFSCSKCDQELVVDKSAAGILVACPKCGQALSVPISLLEGNLASKREAESLEGEQRPEKVSQESFHILVNGDIKGPYTFSQLLAMYADKEIPGDAVYCKDGSTEWHPISEIAKTLESSPTSTPTFVAAQPRSGLKRVRSTICLTVVLIIIWFAARSAWSVVRSDRSPLGKTEEQVARVYGEPIKVENESGRTIECTYLIGDILAEVRFYRDKKYDRSVSVSYHKDSTSIFNLQRVTIPEAQRFLNQISNGRKWQSSETAGDSYRWESTVRRWRFKSEFPWLFRAVSQEWIASYEDGFLFVDWEDIDSPRDFNTAVLTDAVVMAEEAKPTALDAKNGFREYRLGMKKEDVRGQLTDERSFAEDTETYDIENFDHALGDFQIESISLVFDRGLGIVKQIMVGVKGKQNIAGILESFKVAYGEPTSDIIEGKAWSGVDTELNYSWLYGDERATATWTSKKIEKLIEDDRNEHAKHGAAGAAKDL